MHFDFKVDERRRTIMVTKEFIGRRQLIWDCHTKSKLLDRWFAPKGLTTQTRHMDFREGGYWHYAMLTPDGQMFWNRLDHETIDPIDGYTAHDGFCDESGSVNPEMPGSHWDVTFADAGGRTLVTTVVEYTSTGSLQTALGMG